MSEPIQNFEGIVTNAIAFTDQFRETARGELLILGHLQQMNQSVLMVIPPEMFIEQARRNNVSSGENLILAITASGVQQASRTFNPRATATRSPRNILMVQNLIRIEPVINPTINILGLQGISPIIQPPPEPSTIYTGINLNVSTGTATEIPIRREGYEEPGPAREWVRPATQSQETHPSQGTGTQESHETPSESTQESQQTASQGSITPTQSTVSQQTASQRSKGKGRAEETPASLERSQTSQSSQESIVRQLQATRLRSATPGVQTRSSRKRSTPAYIEEEEEPEVTEQRPKQATTIVQATRKPKKPRQTKAKK
ncbi:hypothetical protein EDC96DRAFT_581248 [Choanephora cucurbitarum]|nr:hypothetical protein EDC96DRAFT_581248 [Choanephora cucurbitarum]